VILRKTALKNHSSDHLIYSPSLKYFIMISAILLSLVLTYDSSNLVDTSSVLTGYLIIEYTGEKIKYGTVKLLLDKKVMREAQTDAEGFYSINHLTPGVYTLEATFPDHKTKRIECLHIRSSQNIRQDVIISKHEKQKTKPKELLLDFGAKTVSELLIKLIDKEK